MNCGRNPCTKTWMTLANFTEIHPDHFEPGPFSLMAGISLLPEELERRCGIKFFEILEDLGPMDVALIQLSDGTRYILQRYQESPVEATKVLGIKDGKDTSGAIRKLFDCLGLGKADLYRVVDATDSGGKSN